MKRSRKIELIFLFGIGVVTSVCSIMRMMSITQVKKDGNNWGLVLWGSAEMNIGVSHYVMLCYVIQSSYAQI